jgi:hypothetical protein
VGAQDHAVRKKYLKVTFLRNKLIINQLCKHQEIIIHQTSG